jgi:hypothetical protein
MDNPKRLGKPGSYRLGDLRKYEPKPPARYVPKEASFGPPRPRVISWLVFVIVTAACVAAAAFVGAWFVPFIAGLGAGVLSRYRGLRSCSSGVVIAVTAGWAAPLCWQRLRGLPVGSAARTVAALSGLPPNAETGIAATLVLAIAQALAAFWLARALTPRPRP